MEKVIGSLIFVTLKSLFKKIFTLIMHLKAVIKWNILIFQTSYVCKKAQGIYVKNSYLAMTAKKWS